MIDAKIYAAENKNKSRSIRELEEVKEDVVSFWVNHVDDCLDEEVRLRVKHLLAFYSSTDGMLTASQIYELKRLVKAGNFVA